MLPENIHRIADLESAEESGAVLGEKLEFPKPPSPSTCQTPRIQVTHIQPSQGWVALQLRELWFYRELLFFLAWRDIKVRYTHTVLGITWAIIQPLFTMAIFSLFFGYLAKVPSDGIPYPIFSFTALVPWTFFAYTLTQSSESVVANSNLVKKVYFPRLIIPMSTVLSGAVDFLLAFVVLLGMMMYYGIFPSWNLAWLPFFLLLALVSSLGVGVWLSALNVIYRDVRYTLLFIVQVWLFATPIAYSSTMLSEPWKSLYGLNPMAGVVEGFRWTLLDTAMPPIGMLAISALVSMTIFVSGIFFFRRMERVFVDQL